MKYKVSSIEQAHTRLKKRGGRSVVMIDPVTGKARRITKRNIHNIAQTNKGK